jgi:hypothetical protein
VSAKMEKMPIAGVKRSGELLQVNISGFSNVLDAKFELSRLLSANHINMPFLSGVFLEERSEATGCVSAAEESRVRQLIQADSKLRHRAEFFPSVGLISLFPHQSSLKVLGLSLFALGAAGLPLHGMCSSLSALTLITRYDCLEDAVASLQEHLDVPRENDAFEADLKDTALTATLKAGRMQTNAVYWERRVKTYGFQSATDLCLLEIKFPIQRITSMGLSLYELGEVPIGFHLVAVQASGSETCRVYLLIRRHSEAQALECVRTVGGVDRKNGVFIVSPLELLHFQGPHYGDRYGIAEAAFRALAFGSVPVPLAACSQSCVCLVLPASSLPKAEMCLAEVFEVPARKTRFSEHRSQTMEKGNERQNL